VSTAGHQGRYSAHPGHHRCGVRRHCTSPLYALRECFFGSHSVLHAGECPSASVPDHLLVLIVISVKYIAIVMRADNQGEGGILALTALLPQRDGGGPARRSSC